MLRWSSQEGGETMGDQNSMVVRAGSTTYFIDIKQTREGQPFMVITESRFRGEGKEHERRAIMVFKDKVQDFSKAVSEMSLKVA